MYFDWRLWQWTRGYRARIAAAVVLGLLGSGIGIARFALLAWMLALVFRGASAGALVAPGIAAVGAVLLRGALEHARTVVAHGTAARIQEALRGRLYDKIADLGPAWLAGERTGAVTLSVVDGVERLQTFFGQYLPQLSVAAVTPIVIFAFIAWWDVPAAAVMLVFAVAGLAVPSAVHRWASAASHAQDTSARAFSAEFLDALQGLGTLKAFGQSAAYGRLLGQRARTLAHAMIRVLAISLITRGITDVAIALGAGGALAVGAYRVSHGFMTLPSLLVVLMAGTEVFRPLRDLRTVMHQGLTGQAAAMGIKNLLDAGPPLEARGGERPAALQPSIAFENVHFSYPGGRRAALDGLSFDIAAGERIGIVGMSGAGKSSIARLLMRLYDPQAGAVRIGGRNLRDIDPEVVRAHIAVVQQDTYLFHGTIEDNLRLGRPDATAADLEAAARAANAHEFIAALPDGYASRIGERGAKLSGGQRQRLAIARALLRNAPILILDEALSSVDAENEAVIQEALDRLMVGRTTLILAHRLSSVIGADRIVVIDAGRVVESGRHETLMGRDGAYRRLMGEQAHERGEVAEPARSENGAPAPDALGRPGGGGAAGEPDAILRADRLGLGRTVSALMRFVRPQRLRLALTVSLAFGRTIAYIGVAIAGALIVAAIRRHAPYGPYLVVLAIVAPLAGILHWIESWLAHDVAYRLLVDMRIALYQKLDSLAPAYLLRRRSGDLVGLATQDIETIEYFFAHTIAPVTVAAVIPAAVLAVLAAVAWPTAAALAPFLVHALWQPLFVRRRIDEIGGRVREGLGRLTAHVTDTIQGLSELVAFQAVGRRREEFLTALRAYNAVRLRFLGDLSWQTAQLEMVTGLGGLAVALTGGLLAVRGRLDPGMLPLLTLLAVSAFLPIAEIASVGRQLADTFASTRRLQAVHAEPIAVTDGPATPALPSSHGSSIRFDRVTFAYPETARPALTSVTLEVPAGATVALVGPSGAGKTTMANLLLRFWDPRDGAITLDGLDLRHYQLDHLRRRIALVAEHTYLFNQTLRANVRLARPEATDREIALAVERAALSEFVASLPDGLDTPVGEHGMQLSGGQRQRVAIARAFLKNAPVLILDEATSHLDAVNEALIREALADLMRGRTTIVIAHRLSTVRTADLIAVLDQGRLVETGTHAGLLARGGLYAALVGRQLGGLQCAPQRMSS